MAGIYKGGNDVGDWGEKDLRGAYRPGTVLQVAGRAVRPDTLPDHLGAKDKRRGRKAAQRR